MDKLDRNYNHDFAKLFIDHILDSSMKFRLNEILKTDQDKKHDYLEQINFNITSKYEKNQQQSFILTNSLKQKIKMFFSLKKEDFDRVMFLFSIFQSQSQL